jgi:hypothetical protein
VENVVSTVSFSLFAASIFFVIPYRLNWLPRNIGMGNGLHRLQVEIAMRGKD